MTAYFCDIDGEYIVALHTNDNANTEGNITEKEYNTILDLIHSTPSAPEGCVYRLREDLAWELCELPPAPDPEEEEVTGDEIEAALEGIL